MKTPTPLSLWLRMVTISTVHLGATMLLLSAARAEVRLPAIFSDHMVFMRAESVPMWGRAAAGEHVRVTLHGQTAETDAGLDGRWQITLNLKDSGPGPFEMVVQGGTNELRIADVAVGEVWVASGQSNMELPLRVTAGADAEIARSANPLLRQFAVKRTGANQPLEDCEGQWTVAAPGTSGEFTAIGYYFGQELQAWRKQGVGIIHASQGGTFIEPWTPAEALEKLEAFRAPIAAKQKAAADYPALKAKFAKDFSAWLRAHDREDQPCPALSDFTRAGTQDWTTVKLPTTAPVPGFPASGVFWLRRDIDVSAILARQGFKIMIGPLGSDWQVYWNGEPLTAMTYAQMPGKDFACYFPVPPERILTGRNTLAIRVFAPTAPLVMPGRALWAGPIVLDGDWSAKVERAFPDLAPAVLDSAPRMTYRLPDMLPGSLYNARIHPLTRYAIAGVLWYQGESNVSRAWQYRDAFAALIGGWRARWGRADLPFYFCQLSNNYAKAATPGESAWAELRESQARALALPGTGQAVTVDLGEAGDLHSRDKKTVGHRLFLLARAKYHGQAAVVCEGPRYESMSVDGPVARLQFHVGGDGGGGALVAGELPATYVVKSLLGETAPLIRHSPRSQLEGFAICGEDRKWRWAQAKIDGDSVLVWSDEVPKPVAVRYAWADNPTCNLVNAAGLPASPFRTDDFPATTANARY